MQKRIALDGKRQDVLAKRNLMAKLGTHHAAVRGLAHGRRHLAKALEVLLAQQRGTGRRHRLNIQWVAMPPHRTARKHRARVAIGNTVRIRTGTRIKACRKAFTGLVDLVYGDIFGQEGIHSPQPPTARQSQLSVRYGHADKLCHRMHAGIGTSRTRQVDRTAQERLNSST